MPVRRSLLICLFKFLKNLYGSFQGSSRPWEKHLGVSYTVHYEVCKISYFAYRASEGSSDNYMRDFTTLGWPFKSYSFYSVTLWSLLGTFEWFALFAFSYFISVLCFWTCWAESHAHGVVKLQEFCFWGCWSFSEDLYVFSNPQSVVKGFSLLCL